MQSGTGNWFDLALAKDIARGIVAYPGRRLDAPHAWAFLPDLARAFVAVAEIPEAGPAGPRPAFERFHFSGHTATGAQMLEALEAAGDELCGRPAGNVKWKRAGVPWGLMRLASLCDPMLRELLEMRYLWDTPHTIDGSALDAALGKPLPQTPFREAVRDAVRSLGSFKLPAPVPASGGVTRGSASGVATQI